MRKYEARQKMGTKRTLKMNIRKRQMAFIESIRRKKGFENLTRSLKERAKKYQIY